MKIIQVLLKYMVEPRSKMICRHLRLPTQLEKY